MGEREDKGVRVFPSSGSGIFDLGFGFGWWKRGFCMERRDICYIFG